MGVDAGTPPGLFERMRMIAADEVAKFMRSGFLRNASSSEGGLTIKGGFLRLLTSATGGGVSTFYVGPITDSPLPDGSPQMGMVMRRNDGTAVLALYDPLPGADGFNQFLGWFDRAGAVVFSDDTNAGQGHARPWLHGGFSAERFADFRYSVTDSNFVTVARALVTKQQPRLEVGVRASTTAADTTGEVLVLVNGVQLGATQTEQFSISTRFYGPLPVAGDYGAGLTVEIQGRRTAGAGALRIEPYGWRTQQS